MSLITKVLTFFHITNIAEIVALIAALALLRRSYGIWRWFIPQLTLTILVELSGWYLNTFKHIRHNALPFNLLMLTTVGFLIWLYGHHQLFANNKAVMIKIKVAFILAGLVNLFFGQGLWTYNYFSESAGDLIVASLCLLFFYRHLRDETYRNFFDDPWFWLTNGLFFVSMGNAILYLYVEELAEYYRSDHIDLYGTMNDLLNLIYYSSLIIAFICRRRLTGSSPEW